MRDSGPVVENECRGRERQMDGLEPVPAYLLYATNFNIVSLFALTALFFWGGHSHSTLL
jgi:hypothetical protein